MDYNYRARSPLTNQNRFLTLATPSTPTRFVNRNLNLFEQTPSPSTYREALSSSQPSTEKLTKPGDWFHKTESFFIINIEHEHEELNFKELFQKYFYTDFHYISTNPMKTKEWYEAILIATKSIETQHAYQPDRERPGLERLAYSKCKLLQILTPQQWKASAFTTPIAFPRDMRPSAFSYLDYIKAWENFLLIRPCTHSWFIQIKTDFSKQMPCWFLHWWEKFGITADILPPEAFKQYEAAMKMPSKSTSIIEKAMKFFFDAKYPWIIVWQFGKSADKFGQMTLTRQIKIKWWVQFDESKQNSGKGLKDKGKAKDETESISSKKILSEKLKEMEKMKKKLEKMYEEIATEQPDSPTNSATDDFDPFGGQLAQSPPHFF